MQARPYKIFGAAERALLQAAAEARVRDWSAQWLGAAVDVACLPAPELAAREPGVRDAAWTCLAGSPGEWACIGASAAAAAWWGASSAIVGDIARRSLRDLASSLLGNAALRASQGPEAAAWRKGSAVLALCMDAGAEGVRVLLSDAWAGRVLRARLPDAASPAPVLCGLREAIAARPVALRVLLGRSELGLRDLRGLSVGSVIALESRLEQPVEVELAGTAAPMLRARLVAAQGRRAAALVSAR